MELDHIFFFIEPHGPEISVLEDMGLKLNYSRQHPGQGTENACFVFDNMFLELLWVHDFNETRSDVTKRLHFDQRSKWQDNRACPFGLSYRCDALGFETWDYRPSYLPDGMTILVAIDSDDVQQPLIFQSPGRAAPIEWPEERQNGLQHDAGFTFISRLDFYLPETVQASNALKVLADKTQLNLLHSDDENYRLDCVCECRDGDKPLTLSLPFT